MKLFLEGQLFVKFNSLDKCCVRKKLINFHMIQILPINGKLIGFPSNSPRSHRMTLLSLVSIRLARLCYQLLQVNIFTLTAVPLGLSQGPLTITLTAEISSLFDANFPPTCTSNFEPHCTILRSCLDVHCSPTQKRLRSSAELANWVWS